MSWLESLIIHSFKGIELELINGEWKKKPKGMKEGWNDINESCIKKQDKGLGVLTGKKSGVLVLDFDNLDLYNDYIMKYPILSTAPIVKTRKGFHLYFNWNDKYTELPSKLGKLDIQGNGKQVFYVGTEYTTETGDTFTYSWEQQGELIDLPNDLFQELKNSAKPKKTLKINENNFVIECNNKLWKELIENINIKYVDEYQSWFQIVCGLYAIGKEADELEHYKEVARNLSMKSKKYDKTHKEFEKLWEVCYKYSFTGGSIRHYSRLSNEDKYLNICKKNVGKPSQFYVFDEKLLCDYFIESYGDNLICNKNKIFIYLNNAWREDNKGVVIQKFLRQEVTNLYKHIINDLNIQLQNPDADSEVISKNIKETTKVLTNYGNQKNKNVWGLIYSELMTRNIDNEIFDTKKNLFVFNNKAYDFDTSKWVYVSKFDYVLMTCGRDYKEPSTDQMHKVKYLFDSIFPNVEYRKAYISILKSGLVGTRMEKFIVATGGGRNGKGLINDFYQYLMGLYYGILHLCVITKEIKGGANTELRNIHKKRFLKASEPDAGSTEKLRMANIKQLTGEHNLKARGLYENDFDIQIDATIIMECNKLPYITMDGNEAEKQRMLIVPFETTFTDDQEDINQDPIMFRPKDPVFKTDAFKEEHYSALFKYLIDNHEGLDLYVPDACKKLALKWLMDKDDFVGWFFETYREEDNAITSVKELYKVFKSSSFFSSMSKSQQRQNNEKAFRDMLKDKLKHLFIPLNSMYNGVRITKDSIKGYTYKGDEDDSDDDM